MEHYGENATKRKVHHFFLSDLSRANSNRTCLLSLRYKTQATRPFNARRLVVLFDARDSPMGMDV